MRESRTNKTLRASFSGKVHETGYISSYIPMNNGVKKSKDDDYNKRTEIQANIRKMIEQKKSIEQIMEMLNQEKYKPYERYFETWIQSWVIKLNPDIRSVLVSGLKRNMEKQEIIERMQQLNSEAYILYRSQIEQQVEEEFKTRELWKKREEMREQEKIKKQEEEER